MRKLKVLFFSVIVLFVLGASIKEVVSQSNPNLKDRFYLGPMNFFFDSLLRTSNHMNWYGELFYNMMHNYCGHFDTILPYYQSIGQRDGGFFEPLLNYESYIRGVIDQWHNKVNTNSLIFEREKILRPAYGQRFTYQVEDVGTWENKFPSYGYKYSDYDATHDVEDYWMGEHVRSKRCVAGIDQAGFMVKGLFENCGQTNDLRVVPDDQNSSGWERLFSDIKERKYKMRWFVKPRMRIDSAFAKTHPNDTVITVYTKRFDGRIIDSTSIICNNFLMKFGNQFFYDGKYLETFFQLGDDGANFLSISSDSLAIGKGSLPDGKSQVDYMVKWNGKVDVWLDYVRVDDSWAHYLFTDTWTGGLYPDYNMWHFKERIKQEVDAFKYTPGLAYFWVDEVQYPNLECIGEVNRLVREYSNNQLSLLFITDPIAFQGWSGMRHQDTWNPGIWDSCISRAVWTGALRDIMVTQWFPVYYTRRYPPNLNIQWNDSFPGTRFFQKANNYYEYTSDNNYGIQPAINERLKQHRYFIQKAKSLGLTYGVINQLNSDEGNIQQPDVDWGIREPTNEEISLIMNTSLAYGSKLLLEYSYGTGICKADDYITTSYRYAMGLTAPHLHESKRFFNYFHQLKWNYVRDLNAKIIAVGNYMYPPGNLNAHLVHDKTITVNPLSDCSNCGLPYSYISDIKSIYRDATQNYTDGPSCPNCDPSDKKYWEIGFFNPGTSPANDKSRYFLALNKRTYPDISQDGDLRQLKILFNPTALSGFNNWVLKDAVKDSVMIVFNKNSGAYIDGGIFQPGEGKLLKLAPVMQEGGTFVCDEAVNGLTFDCKATVFTGTHNLDITGSTIYFTTQGMIRAEAYPDSNKYTNIINSKLYGKGSSTWYGIYASGLWDLYLDETEIKNIHSGWAVQSVNCVNTELLNSNIDVSNANIGAFVINNATSAPSSLIWNNTITTKSYTAAIALINSAQGLGYTNMNNNIINTIENGNIGVLMTNTTVDLERNSVSGYLTGYNLIGCSGNFNNNRITSGRDDSKGINSSASSVLSLGNLGDAIIGGNNIISNSGSACININVDDSYFTSDYGYNSFSVNNTDGNYNFKGDGTFPAVEGFPRTIFSRYNCFNGVNGTARHEVRDPRYIQYDLIQLPHYCSRSENEDVLFTVALSENITDTIFKGPDSLNQNLSDDLIQYKAFVIDYLKRNFDSTSIKGYLLLTNYSNAAYTPDIISKLYFSALSLDSTGEKVQTLKTFYEQLIINHPENEQMVKSAYYHIQKCKVYLEQYQSALAGFEDIIAQNPYGYEGLLASWDYAATLLLMDTIGAGGMSNKSELNEYSESSSTADFLVDTLRTKRLTKYDNYDKSVFTQNDRKTIIQNTAAIFSDNRNKQVEKVKELEKKVKTEKGESLTKSANELQTMKSLNEVVKTKKAKDQPDYLRIVTEDVSKVFRNSASEDNKIVPNIPLSYNLYQNYPNPFNPSTKIAFDLPQDGKVKLEIYDILGRQIKTLVDNELRTAGKYTIEFNGSNLASGVYFYRLQVEGVTKFTAVKKMVLIK